MNPTKKTPRRTKNEFFIKGLQPWSTKKMSKPSMVGKPTTFWLDFDVMLLPESQVSEVFDQMLFNPQHRFCVITTETKLLKMYMEGLAKKYANVSALDNIWIGTKVENKDGLDRVFSLLETQAAGHFAYCTPTEWLSLECAQVQGFEFNAFTGKFNEPFLNMEDAAETPYKLDWVIAGGRTDKRKPTHPAWIRNLQFEAEHASLPFYYIGTHWVQTTKQDAEISLDVLGNKGEGNLPTTVHLKWSKQKDTKLRDTHYQEIPFTL